MTKEEFIEKYGRAKVKFSSYYKFIFVFAGMVDADTMVVVNVGGNSDDIYRMEVSAGVEETIADLDPISGDVWKDGIAVESFYDY